MPPGSISPSFTFYEGRAWTQVVMAASSDILRGDHNQEKVVNGHGEVGDRNEGTKKGMDGTE